MCSRRGETAVSPLLLRARGSSVTSVQLRANRLHHVHWHVVPRYEKQPRREFAGRTFVDKRQDKIFRTKRFKLPGVVLDEICAHVKKQLD
jgi:diadenosine tetraphosphate (Ap4A) HIT family hydrolase